MLKNLNRHSIFRYFVSVGFGFCVGFFDEGLQFLEVPQFCGDFGCAHFLLLLFFGSELRQQVALSYLFSSKSQSPHIHSCFYVSFLFRLSPTPSAFAVALFRCCEYIVLYCTRYINRQNAQTCPRYISYSVYCTR